MASGLSPTSPPSEPAAAMTATPLCVLDLVGLGAAACDALAESPFGPFLLRSGPRPAAGGPLSLDGACDAVLVDGAGGRADDLRIEAAARDVAVLVVDDEAGPERALHWLRAGAEDLLSPADLTQADRLARRLHAAIERKRVERESRTTYATDLETGLPHQQQLMEHMSQLLALREREPSPMAVLALRVEGLATVRARLGRESANVLRRKVAVRLRAGVRASDVVASLGDDSFALLLGAMLSPADAHRVGAKLLAALHEPFKVAGNDVALAAALGIAQFPEDGAEPETLLRRAVGLAAATPAQGRLGHANFEESGRVPPGAANDE